MTTILGIEAFDPKLNRDYILIASDSQATYYNDKSTQKFKKEDAEIIDVKYNQKKLIRHRNKIIAYSGTDINNFKKESTKKAFKTLKSENLPEKEYKKQIKIITKEVANRYIFASNRCNQLNLTTYSSRFQYFTKIFPFIKKEEEQLYAFFGSGHPYAHNLMQPYLKEKTQEDEFKKKLVISLDELIDLSHKGLMEASIKDKFTGGHMDIAIITKYNIQVIIDYFDLKYKSLEEIKSFENIEK